MADFMQGLILLAWIFVGLCCLIYSMLVYQTPNIWRSQMPMDFIVIGAKCPEWILLFAKVSLQWILTLLYNTYPPWN